MAFTSGNVKSINEFVDAMVVFATGAPGWTLLAGSENQSDSGAFPLNSQYYRLEFTTAPAGSTRNYMPEIDLRSTAGGADIALTVGNIQEFSGEEDDGFNTVDLCIDNNAATFWNMGFNDNNYIEFDMGAATLLREIVITASATAGTYAPSDVRVLRSEDGRNWDLVHTFSTLSFAAGEAKVLTLPVDATFHGSATATGGVRRPCEYWLQGPGYDAERRVYLGFDLFQDFTDGNQGFRMNGATAYNGALLFNNQLQGCPFEDQPYFVIDNSGEDIDYWLYVSSHRIFAVLRAGAGDYAQFYTGFLSAFPNPDQHPNPLYLAGTSPNIGDTVTGDFYLWNQANTGNSAPWDPQEAAHLDYQGNWVTVKNNDGISASGRNPTDIDNTSFYIYPWFIGSSWQSPDGSSYAPMGATTVTNGDHFLRNQVVTLQDELPVFDAILFSKEYGNIGKLAGIISVPGAASLVPEQVITLGAQNYRVFPKRTIRDDAQWIAIEEL